MNHKILVENGGETLLVISVNTEREVFDTIIGGRSFQAQTLDRLSDMVKASLPRVDMTKQDKRVVRSRLNYLSENYGGLTPQEYMEKKENQLV